MEPEHVTPPMESSDKFENLKKVTPLSKYLSMILFIILPFIGGWIGYVYMPEKVTEDPVLNLEYRIPDNFEVDEATNTQVMNLVELSPENTKESFFSLPSTPVKIYEKKFDVIDRGIGYDREGLFDGDYSWGSGPPELVIREKVLSITEDPSCEYACVPQKIIQVDYYTYNNNHDLVLFYSEELDASHINEVNYFIVGSKYLERFTFVQNIKRGYCCDDTGEIQNRVFDVDLQENRTTIRTDYN